MKTNKQYVLRSIAGEHILIPTGTAATDFNGMINLSDVAAFVWKNLDSRADLNEVVHKITEEYEVDEATARKDTELFINALLESNMIEL